MDKIMYVSYATKNTPYEDLLRNTLWPSLLRNGLSCDFELPQSRGNWILNTQIKAEICYRMLIKHQCPIVMLDADAKVVRYPSKFEELTKDYDVAFHNLDTWLFWKGQEGREKREALTGTLFLNYTPATLELVSKWVGLNENNPKMNDMQSFQAAIKERSVRIYQLPIEYTTILKFNNELPKSITEPVIIHSQASRKYKNLK
jgi:hypothetical protein